MLAQQVLPSLEKIKDYTQYQQEEDYILYKIVLCKSFQTVVLSNHGLLFW